MQPQNVQHVIHFLSGQSFLHLKIKESQRKILMKKKMKGPKKKSILASRPLISMNIKYFQNFFGLGDVSTYNLNIDFPEIFVAASSS